MRTTKKDFTTFKGECIRWINFWGLLGWECCFTHNADDENLATVTYDWNNRSAVFNLATDWPDEAYSEKEIRRAGFHEAAELLLSRMVLYAMNRFVQQREIEEESHNVIRTMENRIFR